MKFERIIRRKVRRKGNGIQIASDVNTALSVNVNEGRSHTRVSSRQTARADGTGSGKEVKEDE